LKERVQRLNLYLYFFVQMIQRNLNDKNTSKDNLNFQDFIRTHILEIVTLNHEELTLSIYMKLKIPRKERLKFKKLLICIRSHKM
jgi:hypothetical protein